MKFNLKFAKKIIYLSMNILNKKLNYLIIIISYYINKKFKYFFKNKFNKIIMSKNELNAEIDADTTTDTTTDLDKYFIKVNYTEAQVVDKNKNFYIKDRRPSMSPIISPRTLVDPINKSKMGKRNSVVLLNFTFKEKIMDDLITKKMQMKNSFEEIISDPEFKNIIK